MEVQSGSAAARAMSVSTRSPMIHAAPIPLARSNSLIGRCGLPATSGMTPVAACTAATIAPPPGSRPPGTGYVGSVLVAMKPRPGSNCVRRSGQSFVTQVPIEPDQERSRLAWDRRSPRIPASASAVVIPSEPRTITGCSASSSIPTAASEEVTIESGSNVDPGHRRYPLGDVRRRLRAVVGGEIEVHSGGDQALQGYVRAGDELVAAIDDAIDVADDCHGAVKKRSRTCS